MAAALPSCSATVQWQHGRALVCSNRFLHFLCGDRFGPNCALDYGQVITVSVPYVAQLDIDVHLGPSLN